jgi:hypothetical protein
MKAVILTRGMFRTVQASGFAAAALYLASVTAGYAAGWPICMAVESDLRCDYITFRQCLATSKDIGGSCRINPVGWGYQSTLIDTDRSASISAVSGGSESIRARCIAQAQAQYPEDGFGTRDVMAQRTAVYRNCAVENGIRP